MYSMFLIFSKIENASVQYVLIFSKIENASVQYVLMFSKIENATLCSLPQTHVANSIPKGTILCS